MSENKKENKEFKNETQFVFSDEFVGFTTIPNTILNDTSISFKALGIYCKILQYQNSPTHKIYQCAFKNFKTDGAASIASGFAELISAGYLKKEYRRNEKNQFCGITYTVFMNPQKNNKKTDKSNDFSDTRFSNIGNDDIGKSDTKNKINKNKINKNKIKSSDDFKKDPKTIIDDFIKNIDIKKNIDVDKMKSSILEKFYQYQKKISNIKSYLEQSILNYLEQKQKNYKTSNSFTNYEQREVNEEYAKLLDALVLTNINKEKKRNERLVI